MPNAQVPRRRHAHAFAARVPEVYSSPGPGRLPGSGGFRRRRQVALRAGSGPRPARLMFAENLPRRPTIFWLAPSRVRRLCVLAARRATARHFAARSASEWRPPMSRAARRRARVLRVRRRAVGARHRARLSRANSPPPPFTACSSARRVEASPADLSPSRSAKQPADGAQPARSISVAARRLHRSAARRALFELPTRRSARREP